MTIDFQKLLTGGLMLERLALGGLFAFAPKVLADDRASTLFARGFGIRHLALGILFWSVREDSRVLRDVAILNACVEAADAAAILRESKLGSGSPPAALALGGILGAGVCLALAYLLNTELESGLTSQTSPSSVAM